MRDHARAAIRAIFSHLGYEIRRSRPDPWCQRLILERIHALKPIRLVFDVGANEGQSALEFREWFPDARIVSFEPHAPTFAKLRARAHVDPLWDVENLALGADAGTRQFHENAVSGANSLLPTDQQSDALFPDNPHRTQALTNVSVDRLDAYCARNGISAIDLLNIDTQGFDLEVLRGCGRFLEPTSTRIVIVEALFVPLYLRQARFHDILGLMEEHGYKLYRLIGGHADERRGLYWSNALFIAC